MTATLNMIRFVFAAALVLSTNACPDNCFCPSTRVVCTMASLSSIPTDIPEKTTSLVIKNGDFTNTTLTRQNFTSLTKLTELVLSRCGIERIASDTFADLANLKRLDLSKNKIRNVDDHAFRDTDLSHLFLSGNLGIRFDRDAFAGAKIVGINLDNCDIDTVNRQIFKPIAGSSLKTLSLYENKITSVDADFESFLQQVPSINLWDNPFHCNCDLRAVHSHILNAASGVINSKAPTCATPSELAGRSFDDLTEEDFICDRPAIVNLEVNFDQYDSAYLLCSAQSDPLPNIYWITSKGDRFSYFPMDKTKNATDAVLRINRNPTTTPETYTCFASTPAGNVTARLNISWPPKVCPRSLSGGSSIVDPSTSPMYGQVEAVGYPNDSGERLFTVTELTLAVVGTFLGTLLLCILILLMVNFFGRSPKRRSSDKSSNSQLRYDGSDDLEFFEFKPMLCATQDQNGTVSNGRVPTAPTPPHYPSETMRSRFSNGGSGTNPRRPIPPTRQSGPAPQHQLYPYQGTMPAQAHIQQQQQRQFMHNQFRAKPLPSPQLGNHRPMSPPTTNLDQFDQVLPHSSSHYATPHQHVYGHPYGAPPPPPNNLAFSQSPEQQR